MIEINAMSSPCSRVRKGFQGLRNKLARERAKQWVRRGEGHLSRGATEEALRCSKRALSRCGYLKKAHKLMAKAIFPGDDYITILSNFHDRLKPHTYVEVGVASGASLAQAKPGTTTIGIDPRPRISETIRSRAKLYPLTSDEFFESYDLFEELGEPKLSLAFIDGAHVFESALRDFANLERYADEETIIFIHDFLPLTPLVAARERSTSFWCGDVWKLIPSLNTYRPDLTMHLIPTFPSGLGVITNLDPISTVLITEFSQIISECENYELGYDFLDLQRFKSVIMIPNNWEQISKAIIEKSSKESCELD